MYEKDIRVEDLPQSFQEIAEEIGLESTIKLIRLTSGVQLYVPIYERICISPRNRRIKEEFKNGKSIKELSKIHKMSTRAIYQILWGN